MHFTLLSLYPECIARLVNDMIHTNFSNPPGPRDVRYDYMD